MFATVFATVAIPITVAFAPIVTLILVFTRFLSDAVIRMTPCCHGALGLRGGSPICECTGQNDRQEQPSDDPKTPPCGTHS